MWSNHLNKFAIPFLCIIIVNCSPSKEDKMLSDEDNNANSNEEANHEPVLFIAPRKI